jgi:hypothetical protein
LLLSLKAVKGELYLLILLKTIELSKQIFVLELEQGLAVFIPRELSQDSLALSYRFYDPILRIVYKMCSDEKKEFFALKNEFDINKLFEENLVARVINKLDKLGNE